VIDKNAWKDAVQVLGIVAGVFVVGAICGSIVTILIVNAVTP